VLGHKTALIDVPWPTTDEQALKADLVEIVIQVNGKLRGRISVAADADNDSVGALALADPNVQRFIGDQEIRKTIVVPGRLVNIVV
jgi:leucyl-tRNA synthetase